MNGAPPPGDRDDLVGRLLTGEIDMHDEELLAAMAADPEFAREVHALHSLSIEMDLLGAGKVAAPTKGPEPWPGADRAVVDAVRRRLSRPPLGRRLLWPLVAAAALVAGVWLLSGQPLPFARRDTPLAASGPWPVGEVTRAELGRRGFDWSELDVATLANKATLTFVGSDGKALDTRTVKRPELDDKKWLPSAEFVADLPATFRWTLILDLTGRTPQQWTTEVTLR